MEIKTRAEILKSVNSLFTGIVTLLLFTSCAHDIAVKTQSSKFMSPEAGGKVLASELSIYTGSNVKATVDLAGDQTDNDMVLKNEQSSLAFNANIGILKNLDFIVVANGLDATDMYGVKFQFYGPSRIEAKAGDQSIAITMAGGNQTQSESEGSDLELTPTNEDTTVDLEMSAYDVGIIYGRRQSDDTLLYAGVNYTAHTISGKLDSQNSVLTGKNLNFQASQYGAHVGAMRYFEKMVLKLELNSQTINWDHTDSKTFVFFNVAFGFYWD